MKRWLASIVCLLVVSVAAIPVSAQTRGRRNLDNGRVENTRIYRDSRIQNETYRNDSYNDDYYYGDDRSVWDRSRDKITTAIGAGAGAAIGAIVGGKKGAIIGAIAGGGGAALYTYKIRDQYPRY